MTPEEPIHDQLTSILGMTSDDAYRWMRTTNPQLDGDTPWERIDRGDRDSVVALIMAIAEGVFL